MKLKEQGNESFNKKDYITACSSYDKGIPYLHFAVPFTSEPDIIESDKEHEEEIKAGQELAFILHNNKATCCIKLGDYHAAIVEVWIGISFDVVHGSLEQAATEREGAVSSRTGEVQIRTVARSSGGFRGLSCSRSGKQGCKD